MESWEGYMGGLEVGKGREKCCYNIISKINLKNLKQFNGLEHSNRLKGACNSFSLPIRNFTMG